MYCSNSFGKGLIVFSFTLLIGITVNSLFWTSGFSSNSLKSANANQSLIFNPPKPEKCDRKPTEELSKEELSKQIIELTKVLAEKRAEESQEKRAVLSGDKDAPRRLTKIRDQILKIEGQRNKLEGDLEIFRWGKEDRQNFNLLYQGEYYQDFK